MTQPGERRSRLQAPSSRLYAPKPVHVEISGATPASVNGRKVESIRERWLVEDRWWSSDPLRRHYLEVVLDGGRCAVVFCDLTCGRWYEQR